jgi:predicted transcriptional regulator of viral defense system
VRKIFNEFSYRQLDRWEKRGYLKKIKQGYYCLAGQELDQNFLFYTANRIYSPSYISLERALKFYGLIPEEIFQVTSVATRKTASFETSVGNFSYRRIKPSLFWGYRLVDFGKQKILLADPEKALLDYFYLNPKIKTTDDFREMRINVAEFQERINLTRFLSFLEAFENQSLKKRIRVFLTTT